MEINEYRVFADECFRDTPPPCGAVCPLDYDMREFIKLMQRGSYRSAYRLYRNSVIFPAFVSELCPGNCEAACVRAQFPGDSAIGIKGLEKALVAKMAGKKPERFQIPKKNQKIAVVGGGAAGLSCAYRFSSFGYDVTLYEREALVGGFAKTVADPVWCHQAFMGEFASVNVDFQLETEVTELSGLEADVIFLATGAEETLFTEDPRVFCGPLDPGESFVEAIARGLRAVTAMEEYLKVGKGSFDPAPVRAKADQRYYALEYDRKGKEPIPGKGEPEAYRCMSCNCDACMKVCPMMEKDKMFPKRMCNEVILTLKPNMSKRTSVRMIMGCTDCGQCREVCPEHVDMGKCLEEARIDFYESGAMSPAFHDFWLEDMAFSMSEEASFVHEINEICEIVFFPGCQLGASMPEYVEKAFEAICRVSDHAALYASCCGVPALWAGRKAEAWEATEQIRKEWNRLGQPLVVTACPTCLKNLRRSIPEMQIQSLYVWLDQHKDCPGMVSDKADSEKDLRVQVLDPCSSIEETESQIAVRNLLTHVGYTVANEAADVGCCGFGGHIIGAAPQLQKQFAERRVGDGEGVKVSYCANCRDVFANEGADARHVLGMLLGIPEDHRRPPELDDRRENRRELKRRYRSSSCMGAVLVGEEASSTDGLIQTAAGTGVEDNWNAMNQFSEIRIPVELVEKMNREFVLREQLKDTILSAETDRSMILDEEDHLYYAHKRFREITLWVVYSKQGDIIEVTNLYVHRVEIRESEML